MIESNSRTTCRNMISKLENIRGIQLEIWRSMHFLAFESRILSLQSTLKSWQFDSLLVTEIWLSKRFIILHTIWWLVCTWDFVAAFYLEWLKEWMLFFSIFICLNVWSLSLALCFTYWNTMIISIVRVDSNWLVDMKHGTTKTLFRC